MANINPFLSKPSEWVEELADIKVRREKLQERAKYIESKIILHLKEKGISRLSGDKHGVVLTMRAGQEALVVGELKPTDKMEDEIVNHFTKEGK